MVSSSFPAGSHNASGSKLSSSDLAALRIDDLRDLVKKTGAQLPREPTKDAVISGLVAKGVSLNDLTRGELDVQLLLLIYRGAGQGELTAVAPDDMHVEGPSAPCVAHC